MIRTDLSKLEIHKLTKEQYEREKSAGTLNENALYMTPEQEIPDGGGSSLNAAVEDNKLILFSGATVEGNILIMG